MAYLKSQTEKNKWINEAMKSEYCDWIEHFGLFSFQAWLYFEVSEIENLRCYSVLGFLFLFFYWKFYGFGCIWNFIDLYGSVACLRIQF